MKMQGRKSAGLGNRRSSAGVGTRRREETVAAEGSSSPAANSCGSLTCKALVRYLQTSVNPSFRSEMPNHLLRD
jgi:hypothetical protein